jgi:hypothetical protein
MIESKDYYKHNLIEYNYQTSDIDDCFSVLLNIKKSIPVIAFRKENVWYNDWTSEKLDIKDEDILSFCQIPTFKFFKR